MDAKIFTPRLGIRIFDSNGAPHDVHGDLISVETTKAMGPPAGKFEITLTSKRDAKGRTWAKRIRPSDYVEFYASRTALPGASNSIGGYTDGQTIIMRGFVDNVAESISVENDKVNRLVVINGRDYGKVLIKRKLVYVESLNPAGFNKYLQSYYISTRFGLDPKDYVISPYEFLGRVKEVLAKDPTLGATQGGHVPPLQAKTDIPDSNNIALMNITPHTGSIWNLLESYQGAPWNELFLRDDDDASRLHWRRSPIHDKDGVAAWGNDQVVYISLADIISENVLTSDNGTSDEGVYCAWLTLPEFMTEMATGFNQAAAYYTNSRTPNLEEALDPFLVNRPEGGYVLGNPTIRTDLFLRYGFAMHDAKYPLFPFPKKGDDKSSQDFANPDKFAANLTVWLHDTEMWAPIMEQGALVIKGNPAIRIGQHVQIREQKREFYVRAVKHKFSIWPKPEFTTLLSVDRGLWLENSPYPDPSAPVVQGPRPNDS